jgi:predicted protein tyrosine phosphatase
VTDDTETLIQKIKRANHIPWDNPYQGTDKKVLFVCSAGILRSATAARLYARKYNTRAAGSADYALIPVTNELLLWADEVVFVNAENHENTCAEFNLDAYETKVVVLDIPDRYPHMAPELVSHFEEQYEPL